MADSRQTRILLVGATGAVGQEVLRQALAHPSAPLVTAVTRRPLPDTLQSHPNLSNPVVDFTSLNGSEPWWARQDAVICTLGTTIKIAKTTEAFRYVDYYLPSQFATNAAQHGTACFVLNSSTLANPAAKGLYLQTKGQAEEAVKSAGFKSVVIARPGLLDTPREEVRVGEEIGRMASRVFNPLLPKRWRSVKVSKLAQVMLAQALGPQPGLTVLESEKFQ